MVIVNSGKVCLIDGADGHTIWGPSLVDGCGGAPTVADVDGDGYPEIGVAGMRDYFCLATDGALKWRDPGQDLTSSATGPVRYELPYPNGTSRENPTLAGVDLDGRAEVVLVGSTFVGPGATGLQVQVGDQGEAAVAAGVPVALHRGSMVDPGARLDVQPTATTLDPMGSEWLNWVLSLDELQGATNVLVVVDDVESGYGIVTECNEKNNGLVDAADWCG